MRWYESHLAPFLYQLILKAQDEKVLNSRVGVTTSFDYSITFRDAQNLELIRRKLVKARWILKSNALVGRLFKGDVTELREKVASSNLVDVLSVIQKYVLSLERHQSVVESLIDRLSGTSKLVWSGSLYVNLRAQLT
jgi:hypothetical protein